MLLLGDLFYANLSIILDSNLYNICNLYKQLIYNKNAKKLINFLE